MGAVLFIVGLSLLLWGVILALPRWIVLALVAGALFLFARDRWAKRDGASVVPDAEGN